MPVLLELLMCEGGVKVNTVFIRVDLSCGITWSDSVSFRLVSITFLQVYQLIWVRRIITTFWGWDHLVGLDISNSMRHIFDNLVHLGILTETLFLHESSQLVHEAAWHVHYLRVQVLILIFEYVSWKDLMITQALDILLLVRRLLAWEEGALRLRFRLCGVVRLWII